MTLDQIRDATAVLMSDGRERTPNDVAHRIGVCAEMPELKSGSATMPDTHSGNEGWCGGDEVEVSDRDTRSRLLGPDGNPIPYKAVPFGFDMRPRGQKETLRSQRGRRKTTS